VKKSLFIKILLGSYFLLILGACSLDRTKVAYEVVYVYVTATLATSTATPTPTLTPTPTPTALPMNVLGDLRIPRIATPVPISGAPCGVVDLLDFPVNPPDAEDARGGGDFGVYRSRYNGYHTGEDWWLPPGSSFGKPVYSIGHGLVTHADPLGWGVDKGTVVLQHTLPDGRKVLSFYGHLDPPSVALRVGECVTRGDKIGEIGQPRTPPHLHFEIRTIFPYQPTRGYVSVDPTELGWINPSHFILNYRNETSPGILWMQPSTALFSQALGSVRDEIFLVVNGSELMGIDLKDGSTRWNVEIDRTFQAFVLDLHSPILYMANRKGEVVAYRVDTFTDTSDPALSLPEVLWQKDLYITGESVIMPLPDGGMGISIGNKLLGLSMEGEILWEEDSFPMIEHWRLSDQVLTISTEGDSPSIWTITGSEPALQVAEINGLAIQVDGKMWIYNNEGIHLSSPGATAPKLLFSLSRAYPDLGDITPLSDGGVLVAHTDIFDRRLISFDADGNLEWDFSFSSAIYGQPILLTLGEQPYILVRSTSSTRNNLAIFSIDLENAELTRIFEGTSHRAIARGTWGYALDNDLIIFNMGGNNMFLLDPSIAQETPSSLTTSP
jgi:murein DD-endopeptidase MepM/ murein hydrolase activator NlpD